MDPSQSDTNRRVEEIKRRVYESSNKNTSSSSAHRTAARVCPVCKYKQDELYEVCPKCGVVISKYYDPTRKRPRIQPRTQPGRRRGFSTLAVVSLSFGVIGFFVLPILFSPIAIVSGVVAIHKNDKNGYFGLILGILGVIYSVVILMIFERQMSDLWF